MRHPTIIGLGMVKNEQDIIEPMIRHNASLLDALILLDNGSVDDTKSIALALARELGNVVVTNCSGFGYTQGERMTRLLHAAQSAYFADYVMFLDADEFIGATSRAALEASVAMIPFGGAGAMEWRNYVLREDTPSGHPPFGFTHRRTTENIQAVKSILRLDGAVGTDLVVGRGSHNVSRDGGPLPTVMLPDLPLWHFPVRSAAQLTAKALVGWLACLAANPRAAQQRESYHWADMYTRITSGPGFSDQDLRTLSMNYGDLTYSLGLAQPPDPPLVRDIPAINARHRVSSGAFLDPLTLVARSWEATLSARDPLFASGEIPNAVVDIPPFRHLMEKHDIKSVLDVGCGTGLMLEMFGRLGCTDLAGVGLMPESDLVMRRGGYVRHDPGTGFSLGRQFSLVLCLDDPNSAFSEPLIGNLIRHADAMIAVRMHGAAKDLAPWLARWRDIGWLPDQRETLAVRCLAGSAPIRHGLIILRPAGTPGLKDGSATLLAVAGRNFQMQTPSKAVFNETLDAGAEAGWFGYAASTG